jgi:protein-tyrosine-phosphatase
VRQMTSVSTTSILVLCSANQCRSPMAQGLLSRHLCRLPTPVAVRSAGLFSEGEPASPEAISALAARGLDLSGHRSHRVTGSDLAWADLVLGMSREHVRHAVVTAPGSWPRAFTLKELVRRGEEAGPRQPAESFASWLARVHEGRTRMALLGDSPADDVADPMGGPPQAYADTVVLLDDLLSRLAALGWGLPAGRLPR